MPIKFTGPVKPRKLKSPDPINMPVIRENKVPKIKSEVLYYKENGKLPSVESDWVEMSDFLQIPNHSGGIDSITTSGDILAIVSSSSDTIYIYKKDGNGVYQQTDTTSQSGADFSAIHLIPELGKVVYSAPLSNSNEGRLVEMELDFSTGILNQSTRNVYPLATARDNSYDGRGIVSIGDTLFSGAPGYYLSTSSRRGGLMAIRDRDTGALKNLDVSYIQGINESNSYIYGNRLYNEDGLFANALVADGDRLISIAPGAFSLNTADNGYLSVWQYDNDAQSLTEIQFIPNPTIEQYPDTQASMRAIAALNGKMLVLVNVGGPDNDYDPARTSLIEFRWNGTEYTQIGWSDLNLSPDWTPNSTDSVIAHMTMLSDTELLIPGTGISGGKIYKVTK